jgi:4-hydroxy-3-polyprenylbenzoate decarboxylase
MADLASFLASSGQLRQVDSPIDPQLELTAVCHRALQAGGPALRFNDVTGSDIPVLGNLFGNHQRIATALGIPDLNAFRALGELLSGLQQPRLPASLGEVAKSMTTFSRLPHVNSRIISEPICQSEVIEGDAVDLGMLPIVKCWPEDVGKLITWGMVVTRGPLKRRINVAVYRQQVIDKNRVIMRWLAHRGGAIDFQEFQRKHPGEPFPVAVVIGADPATLLAAAAPIPDTISEYQFAGLIRGSKSEVALCLGNELVVPAQADIVLEGNIYPDDYAEEGPFGDHTGYYNSVEKFPVLTVGRITHRPNPTYLTTYMGRPGQDEPSVIAQALNEMYIPILQQQFPEITDFYLPTAACSYRIALVSIRKRYPGHARQIMHGIWSILRQFTYVKMVVVTDEDINIRNQDDVLWALSTRMDPARDSLILENSAIDYLDFASPVSGLGGKIGLDATNKRPPETQRRWGRPILPDRQVAQRIDAICNELGF